MNIITDTIPYIHYITFLYYSKVVKVVKENSLKSKPAENRRPLLSHHYYETIVMARYSVPRTSLSEVYSRP